MGKGPEFQEIVRHHPTSRMLVGKYAETFVDSINIMTKCKWRTPVCNDYCTVEDLVQRVFDWSTHNGGQNRRVGVDRYSRNMPSSIGKSGLQRFVSRTRLGSIMHLSHRS